MSAKTKNQKWIYLGVAILAILGLTYWYFTKNVTSLSSQSLMPSEPSDGKPAGQANIISDLPAACKKKFDSWYQWLSTTQAGKTWYGQFVEAAKKKNSTAYKEAANHWLRQYNSQADPNYTC